MYLISQLPQIHLTQLTILQFLDQGLCIFLIDIVLQPLDVSLVVCDPLAQGRDVVRECGRFCGTLALDLLATLRIGFELGLEGLKLTQVLILHLRVLDLDDAKLLLVLLARISEPVSELIRLLSVKLL